MSTKPCTLCGHTKRLDDFPKHKQMPDGHTNQCKTCRSAYLKKYGKENASVLSQAAKTRYGQNRERLKAKSNENWHANKDVRNAERRRKYALNEGGFKDQIKASQSTDGFRTRKNQLRKERRKSDESWRLIDVCRTRMGHALKGIASKSAKTVELLGCNGAELRKYLDSMKIPGKDYGDEPSVDHIIPCHVFDFLKPEHQRACFHYTNLQWLPRNENSSKNGRLPPNFQFDEWLHWQLENIRRCTHCIY